MQYINHVTKLNGRIFNYIECRISSEKDEFVRKLLEKSEIEATNYISKRANDSYNSRSNNKLRSDVFVGLLTEYIWKDFIVKSTGVQDIVQTTIYKPNQDQVDLICKNSKTIEIRSSNVRKGVEFGISVFDILGPYSNAYKKGETLKNFYLRTLYVPTTIEIKNNLIKGMQASIFLVGGATENMMRNDNLILLKDLKTPQQSNNNYQTSYRCIPIKNGLDCKEMIAKLINQL